MIAPVPDFLMLGQAARPAAPFHWNLGDVATWVLALTALGALVAAILAYFKQADAARKLAEQVRLQSDALADQRQANAKQAEVLEAELAGLRQRAEALAWQQADAVTLEPSSWRGSVPGPRTGDGPVHMAVVTNGGYRPIENVVCRMQTPLLDEMYSACRVGRVPDAGVPWLPGAEHRMLTHYAEDATVSEVRAGATAAFIFNRDVASHQGIFTLRFSDDAGLLHWQRGPDGSLTPLEDRDQW